MSRSLSLTDTGHPPLSVKFMTQSKACKCNVSCCYAITSRCVTFEWPVQFSEKALDSTRTREDLICSFLSCFQVCSWCSFLLTGESRKHFSWIRSFKKKVPIWCVWTQFSIIIRVCTESNQPSSPGLVAWCGLPSLGNFIIILKALILQFSLCWGSQEENHLSLQCLFFAWDHLDQWSHWSQWSLCVLSSFLPLKSNHKNKEL